MDTFSPPRAPSPNGTSGEVKARMMQSRFGDGFSQSSPDGLNPTSRSQTLVWDHLTMAEAKAIEDFLDAHIGVKFWYRLPREHAPRSWVWTSRQRTHPLPVHDGLTVMLEERHAY